MKVGIIGGGAAGMLAALEAARLGHDVTLLEQNEKLGKKLFITGKGRCNVTNSADKEAFLSSVVRNPRFLYSAFSAFDNRDMMQLLEDAGVPLKTERGGRVFPESDKSSDVLRALERLLRNHGVDIRLNTRVQAVLADQNTVSGVRLSDGMDIAFDAVVIATGGVSYPQTGSTGDGYRFAKTLGHTVEPARPSLIPLETEEDWPKELSGLTLKNVTLTAEQNGKRVYTELGEMLFTHFGVSGPLVLSASALLQAPVAGTKLFIDLKPGLSDEKLDDRILRDLDGNARKQVGTALEKLLPSRLLAVVFDRCDIDPAIPVGEFTKQKRRALLTMLKRLPLTVKDTRPVAEAIITRGGVSVREVAASTMESKKIRNLFFAGEVLDVDAVTGGYNLQIAWSTGVLAGRSI